MQSRYEGFMVTDPATRYGEGAPGAAVGEMPGAADADGSAPAACRAGDPLVTTTAPTATAITAAAAASGATARRQRGPGIRAGAPACSGELAAPFRVRSFTPASVTTVRRPPHGRATCAGRPGEAPPSLQTSYQAPRFPGKR